MKKTYSALQWPVFILLVLIFGGNSACGKKDNPTYGELMVINASPGLGSVDIYIDNNKFNTAALAYPLHTTYRTLEAGQHTLKVTATGSTTAILEGSLNTLGEIKQSLFIYGLPSSLNVFAVADYTFSPGAGKALVRFFHLSPDGQTIDIGTVTGSTYTSLYTSRSFETSTSWANSALFNTIDAKAYVFGIYEAGTGISLSAQIVGMESGKSYTLFYRGISGDPATPHDIEVIKMKF